MNLKHKNKERPAGKFKVVMLSWQKKNQKYCTCLLKKQNSILFQETRLNLLEYTQTLQIKLKYKNDFVVHFQTNICINLV